MTNGITSIHIDGQEVKLLFGMPAIRQIAENQAKFNLYDGVNYNETGYAHILFAGYCNHCSSVMELPTIKFQHFYFFVENAILTGDIEPIKAAIKCFDESQAVSAVIKSGQAVETKKKNGHGMKSKVSAMESLDLVQNSTGG